MAELQTHAGRHWDESLLIDLGDAGTVGALASGHDGAGAEAFWHAALHLGVVPAQSPPMTDGT